MSNFVVMLDSSKTSQNSDNFQINFNQPIKFNGVPHEVGLRLLSTWFTWFNVSADYGNNIFKYSNDSGFTWETATIPSGNYSIDQLEDAIHQLMEANGDVTIDGGTGVKTYDINLAPNYSTIRLYLELTNGFQVDFTAGKLNELLGFTSAVVTASSYGTSNVNITNSVNTMLLHCSLINGAGSYDNNISSDILFAFVPNVPPGANINITPVSITYIPIDRLDYIDRIQLRLTDQLGRRVNLNGEDLTAWLHIRPRKLVNYMK